MSDQELCVGILIEEGFEFYVFNKRSYEIKISNIWSYFCVCIKDIDFCQDDSVVFEKIFIDV